MLQIAKTITSYTLRREHISKNWKWYSAGRIEWRCWVIQAMHVDRVLHVGLQSAEHVMLANFNLATYSCNHYVYK